MLDRILFDIPKHSEIVITTPGKWIEGVYKSGAEIVEDRRDAILFAGLGIDRITLENGFTVTTISADPAHRGKVIYMDHRKDKETPLRYPSLPVEMPEPDSDKFSVAPRVPLGLDDRVTTLRPFLEVVARYRGMDVAKVVDSFSFSDWNTVSDFLHDDFEIADASDRLGIRIHPGMHLRDLITAMNVRVN